MAHDYDLRLISTKAQLLTYIGAEEVLFDEACGFDITSYEQWLCQDTGSKIVIDHFYPFTRHEIPKRNPARGKRVVWEAERELNNTYKGLARRLTRFLQIAILGFPHPQSFGYVRGRNIRDNADQHVGATLLLKVDIKDFFPSISKARVEKLFVDLEVNSEVATLLASFLTINGKLPLGLPTSPIIANAICHGMDGDLSKLATSSGSTYSRYADDISFSTNTTLPKTEVISAIAARHGFELAKDKTRISKRGQNHYVTGLSISDPRSPHAPRAMKRNLRQELYFAEKFGLGDHIRSLGITEGDEIQRYINHLDGSVRYVAFHEPAKARDWFVQWYTILEKSGSSPSFEPKNQHEAQFCFFVDETDFEFEGKKYLALCLSATQQQDVINTTTERIVKSYLANPFSDGDPEKIKRHGMHFSDACEDLRTEYARALQTLPFQGYIVFGELHGKYEANYTRLLAHIIKRRLLAAESKAALFCFEGTDKVSENAIKKIVLESWDELVRTNNRHPKCVTVKIVDKTFYGVGVPDFLLGVFRRYIYSDPTASPPQRQRNMFEGLRDKIRVIVNADTGEEFTRRHPFENSSIGSHREG